jgi:hypothetical protein
VPVVLVEKGSVVKKKQKIDAKAKQNPKSKKNRATFEIEATPQQRTRFMGSLLSLSCNLFSTKKDSDHGRKR